jgi:hypothetical protein
MLVVLIAALTRSHRDRAEVDDNHKFSRSHDSRSSE